jgi:hypothetical protein
LNLIPAPALSSAARVITGAGKSTLAGLVDSGGLIGELGAGFVFSVTVPAVPAAAEPVPAAVGGAA